MNGRTILSADWLVNRVNPSDLPPDPPSAFAARIAELMELQDGWYNGTGRAPRREDLDWLVRTFEQKYPDDLPPPFLYPTVEGGIRVEWTLPPFELSLEIEATKRCGSWHSLNLKSDEEMIRSLELNRDEVWLGIAHEVRKAAESRP